MDKISITICGDGGCEDSYSVTRNIDGLPYILSITDTAGQEEYRGLWPASTLSSDAFLLVYDITNPSSLGTLDYFMDMIHSETEQRVEDNQRLQKEVGKQGDFGPVGLPPPIKIVVGNKCDLKNGRVVTSRDGLEYARKHGCGFMETSARETVNIEETFARMPCLSIKVTRKKANHCIDIVRRVVEARLQSQNGASPACAESAKHTVPTVVDAFADETQTRRSRAWELIKSVRHRNTTERQGQEQTELPKVGRQRRKKCQKCCPGVGQIWCLHRC
ncbi:uncharacterized protein N7515_008482 [Penicillium bovifimosum]|uniref:Uncharacterized protein n=1 Tax=Penicillium bovifimosum TaxID=126998 RepID=A0A9W9GND5_9EURO|nr:uncharacterized protein N7515_008482 [Penicillium bovifimosum]KAJ5124657.1 hypothetical protein N7515_008482 [Penicillium bovifimosum]